MQCSFHFDEGQFFEGLGIGDGEDFFIQIDDLRFFEMLEGGIDGGAVDAGETGDELLGKF